MRQSCEIPQNTIRKVEIFYNQVWLNLNFLKFYNDRDQLVAEIGTYHKSYLKITLSLNDDEVLSGYSYQGHQE